MAHGHFPTTNNYYVRTEIFPHLTKKEIKEIYYTAKTLHSRRASTTDLRLTQEDRDAAAKLAK